MALHLGKSKGCTVILTHDHTIGRLSRHNWLWPHRCYVQLAVFLGKNACANIETMSGNDLPRSVNDFWSWFLDTPRPMECSWPTNNHPAGWIGKNASDDIAWASYNRAPTKRQQCVCRHTKLHSNAVQCTVPKLCFTRSVFAICACIRLQKYACNVSQIWYICW